nr:MAG TPA: hypothetical protein [Caudoviricetes sp.]
MECKPVSEADSPLNLRIKNIGNPSTPCFKVALGKYF